VYHPRVDAALRRFIRPHIEGRSGVALDAGCGDGLVCSLLNGSGFEIAGFDLCREMVAEARNHCPGAAFAVGDIFAPPFPEETFDLLAISGVLHHVVNYQKALSTLLATLKPGGTVLILNEPNAAGYRILRPVRMLTGRLIPEKRVADKIAAGDLEPGDDKTAEYHLYHGKGVRPREIRKTLESGGCRVLDIDYTNVNILANIGERISLDLLGALPQLDRLNWGRFSMEFNIVARKKSPA